MADSVGHEKPLAHISLIDWHSRMDRMRNVSDARQADALTIRNKNRALLNEAGIETNWANVESNDALTNRIREMEHWREILVNTYGRVDNEIQRLKQEQADTERTLDALGPPICLSSEVLAMRDGRLGSELTYDEPDQEIKTELAIMMNNQRLLTERCQKAWEKMNRLEDLKSKMLLEIENKVSTIDLDMQQLELDNRSTKISYKMNPLRSPKDCSSYDAWLENVKSIKQTAENELSDTMSIREVMFVCREKARNILEVQQDRTEFILRKRIFDTQRARNELDWQRIKIRDEMEKSKCDLDRLQAALDEKASSQKLAETRLENRSLRTRRELCLDNPHYVLCTEVEKMREIRRCLAKQVEDSRMSFNLLAEHANKIDVELRNKQHALEADQRALDLRHRLKEDEAGLKVINPSAQTDRNIEIMNLKNTSK